MKTTITKITAILLTIVLSSYVAFSQIVVQAPTMNVCPGTTTVAVPITVQNFSNVASISLTLDFPLANMSFVNYTNHPSLGGGFILVNTNGPKVLAAWFGLSPLTLANGATLFTFNFTYNCSQSPLTWDLVTQGACQLSDILGTELPTTFVNGAVNCESTPFFSLNPADVSVTDGDPAQFTATASSGTLQWQVSTDGGNSWANLSETPPYSGTTTATLDISAATAAMNGYKYQCVASDAACSLTATSASATLAVTSGCIFPLAYNTIGGGPYCDGLAGVSVSIDNTEAGVVYTLLQDGISTGLTLTGNGGPMSFGLQTGAGIYTVEGTNVCGTTTMNGQAIVTVLPLPTVVFSAIPDICVASGSITLTGGMPLAGNYAGFGVSAGSFDPSVTGVGTFPITYTYTDVNGCTNSAVSSITVNAMPVLGFAPIPESCVNGSPIDLTQASPEGGSYSGNGVVAGQFVPAVAGAGTHTITYTLTDENNCTSSITQTAAVGALPVAYSVTGGGTFCSGGSGVEIGLDGSEIGVVYSLIFDGATIASETGTGAPLNFGFFTAVGSYEVSGDFDGCTAMMSGNATVAVLAGPAVFNVNGNGNYCVGNSGVEVSLSGSETGVTYALYLNGSATGDLLSGTGAALSFGNQTAGLYEIYGTNSCGSLLMDGSAIVVENPLPVAFAVTGGGNFCDGQAGVVVGLDDTELNTTYELFLDGVSTLNAISGTGFAISFGIQNVAGNYTIRATNACGITTMDGSALVTINPLPQVYNLSGNGSLCPGGPGLSISLDGSEAGTTYVVYRNGDFSLSTVSAGGPISFGPYTEGGLFTVMADNGFCTAMMNNTVTISTTPEISITANPVSVSISEGAGAAFSVTAANLDAYQWQVSVDGGVTYTNIADGGFYSGSTTATLSISNASFALNGNLYRCQLTETSCAQEVFSGSALLSVAQSLQIITSAPVITNAVPGQVVVPVTVENFANVASMSLTLAYDGSIMTYTGYQNLSSSFAAGILDINAVGNQVKFAWFDVTPISLANGVLVEYLFDYTGGNGLLVWSATPGDNGYTDLNANVLPAVFNDGSVEGCTTPIVFDVAGGGNLCPGNSSEITLSGSETGVSYVLYINGIPGSNVVTGTGSALSFGSFGIAATFTVQASNGSCTAMMFGNAVTTLTSTLSTTLNPVNVSVNAGETAVFSAGSNIGTTYQWQISTNAGLTFTDLTDEGDYTGSMTAQLTISNVSAGLNGNQYRCVFGETTCNQSVASLAATLNVVQSLPINTIAPVIVNAVPGQVIVPITVENFANVASLSLTFNYDGGIMSYTGYQNLDPAFSSGIMDLNGIGNQVKFAWFDVTPVSLANGTLVEFIFNYTGGDGLFTWSAVPGDNSYTDLNTTVLPAIFTNGSITGCDLPLVYTVNGGGTQCVGGSGFPVGLSNSEAGASYTLYLNGVSTFQTLAGTGAALDFGVQTTPGTYTVVATNFCGTIDMDGSASILYNALPSVFAVGGGGAICAGTGSAAITLSGSETGVLYFVSINGVSSFQEMGTGAALSFNQNTPGVYTIEATNLTTGCQRMMSSSAVITLNPILNITLNPSNVTVTEGNNAVFTAAGDIATAYQWQISTDGGLTYANLTEGAPYSGVQTASLTVSSVTPAMNGHEFRCVLSENTCNTEATTLSGLLTVESLGTITVLAPVITGALPGQVIVPVTVQNMNNVAAISLSMGYNTSIMSFAGYQNLNPALAAGSIVVNGVGNEAKIAWFSITPASISNDVLIEFIFNYTGGSGLFTWSSAPGQNQFTNFGATILPAVFVDGSIEGGCPLPLAFDVVGGGTYCVGGSGMEVSLSGSESNANYTLYYNGVATANVVAGTGNPISFGLQTQAGVYTVVAVNTCGNTDMLNAVNISIDPLPAVFTVVGGGSYCPGTGGVTVALLNSEIGTLYELFLDGVTTGLTFAGDGTMLYFGSQTAAGVYTVTATNNCGTVAMDGSATVSLDPLPFAYDVTGGGSYCVGTFGIEIGLSGSEADATYALYNNGVGTGQVLTGTGFALSFGLQTAAGVYTVEATNACGTYAMNASATVSIDPLPVAFLVTGGGSYCVGGSGVAVGLDGSEAGTTYELYVNGAASGLTVAGTGNPISFGLQTQAGTYTVFGTNHCGTVQMDASATISIDPLPLFFNLTGGGSFCTGGAGVTIDLDGSETNASYFLYVNGIQIVPGIAGTGNALSFGMIDVAGTYTVEAFNNCGSTVMTGSAVVVENPLPAVYSVLGGGIYCAGTTGPEITLSGSESNAVYELFLNGVTTGMIITGTGSAFSFGNQTAAGNYTVVATNACGNSTMAGAASISITNTPSVFNVLGGGSYCIGQAGTDVILSGSESDATYELYLDGMATAYILSGTGSTLTFTGISGVGVYTIVATNGCGSTSMNGSATVSTNPLPTVFNIMGGGAYCPGGIGVNIGIDGSEPGVNYTLYLNGISSVVNVSGNGAGFSFGVFTAPGTYTIVASNSCGTQNMAGIATVSIGSTLSIYNVTGGGTYVAGGAGVPVGLDNSQINVNYELMLNGSPTGFVLAGTGAALDFGNQQTAGTYTIMAVDPYSNCISLMAGGATVVITPIIITNPLDVSIYEGYNASFTVTALGATIYQWQVSTDGGLTFTNVIPSIYYSGVNSNTLYITGAPISWDGYKYQCVVSNAGSPLVYSNAATLLVVNVPAVVTIAPTMTSAAGSNIVIPINVLNFNNIAAMAWTLNYDPSVLTYTGYQNAHPQLAPGMMFYTNNVNGQFLLQWFSMTPANIGDNTVIELLFDYNCGYSPFVWETYPPEASQYGNILANPVPATWVNGSINCSSSLTITDQPDNYTTCEGGTAMFSIATSPAATTYQWMVSTDFGATWFDLFESPLYTGVNTATLTVNGAVSSMSNFLYVCKVNAGLATAAVSNPASIILVPFVNATATIVANPGTIICPGTPVTFSVSSAYAFVGATYNWLINGINVGTGTTYTTTTLANGDVVDVDIIDPANCVIASVSPITMIVDPHPVITSDPADVIAVVGDVVTFSVTATGASTYQWQESTDNGLSYTNVTDGGMYSGATTSVLTISGVTLPMDQYKYRCVVTESLCGNSVTSLAATLNVFTAPIYTYLPNVANCTGYQVVIPVTVDNFIQVASASLKFDFDPSVLSYVNYQNVNPALTGSPSNLLAVSNTGTQINFFWFGPLATATIPNGGVLFEIVFNYATPGTTNLSWDLTPGNTQYTNFAALNIPSFFIDGSATSYPLPIVYDMTGGGEYCIGGVGVEVGVSGSEVGVNYELFLDGVSTGQIVAGTGAAISFGNQLLAGTYTVVATNVTTLCFNNMNGISTVIINPLPVVTWTNILEDVCEEIVALELTGGMPLGGTYSGPGVSNNLFNAAIAGPGPHTLTYTYMDANGCINSATNTITVIDGPTPFPITGGGTFCQGEQGVLVGLSDSEPVIVYQLFINGINSGDPIFGTGGVLNFGYQTVPGVYTIVGLNIFTGCVQLMIGSVTVTEIVPNVTWPTTFANVCENSSPFTLTGGVPAGGTYSGNGVINNIFDPSIAGNGVHTLTYTYTDTYGCTGSATNTIAVVPGTDVTFSPLPDVCVNGVAFDLSTYVTPIGGVFSGTGVTGSTFNPAVAGVGTHTITYAFAANNCTVMITRNISVLALPALSWSNTLTPQCISETAYLLTGATPAGGVYSGTAVAGGVFNPSLAGVGVHTLTYTYTDAAGCTNSITNTITVNALPLVSWPDVLQNQCATSTTYALSGGLPAGGVYSGPGVTAGGNFNAVLAGIGIHTLTYTYTDANGCVNEVTNTISVVPVPEIIFATMPDVCVNGGTILLTSYVSPVGGAFSGTGIIGNTFNPAVAGVGVHVITYTVTVGTCVESLSKNITVLPIPTVSWTNTLASQCVDGGAYFLSGAIPAGGVYSGPGVTGNVFNPALAGAGVHTLTYTYTDANGCTNSATNTITVNALPLLTWTTALQTQCESATSYTLTGALPTGGVYSGPGVSGTNFNANLAGIGIHTITYTYTDPATNCTSEITNTITVVSEPVVTVSPLPDVCVNGVSIALNSYAVPVGGSFSGTGVSGNVFNPSTAGVGSHVITYTLNSNGCILTVTRTINVLPLPLVTWATSLPAQCVDVTSYFLSGGVPAGGVYSGTGVTGNVFNPALAGAGVHTLTYTFTDASGCTNTATNTITVNALPVLTWTNALQTQCESATSYTLSGALPTGGVYSGPGVSGNNFNANLAGIGIHTITYTFTDPLTNCTSEITNTISVVTEPEITFSPLPDVCVNSGTLSLTSYVVPVGGVFTGTGVSGTNFDPSVAGLGTHVITYSVTANGCTVQVSRNITVTPAPAVSWSNSLTTQCVSADAYYLSGGIPAGGVYSGPGVSGTIFNPSLAGIGTHTLTYTYTAANGCTATATNTIVVTALPVVTWSNALESQCITATAYTLTGGSPANGTYSGPGVSGTTFNASILGVGTYVLTYTYTDLNGCTNSATNTITVNPLPIINFSALPDVCDNVSSIILSSYASPVGGAFSGPGVVGGVFQPAIAGVGTHTITYTYTDANGCQAVATRTITVNAATVLSWSNPLAPQCADDNSYFLFGASPVGGFYSGAGVTGNIFNASLAGVGSHVITYTYTNAGGCTSTITNTIVVNALPTVSLAAFSDVCVSASSFVLTGGSPLSGTYSGTGVSGGSFNPTLAGVGLHTITYTFTDPATGCTNMATSTISVVPVPVITFNQLPTVCENAAAIDLSLYVIPVGGVFTGAGVSGTTFNPAAAGVGVHAITYSYTNSTGCQATATRNIAVVAAPVVTWPTSLTAQCVVSTSYFLSGGNPAGGVYSGAGVTGNIFNASLAGAGTHTLTYTYTNANGCTASTTNTIVVYTEPTVTWTLPATTLCVTSTTFALTGAVPATGTFSGPGVSGTNFNAALAGVGIHTITYTYADVNGCSKSVTNTITVTPAPTATLFPLPNICIDGGLINLNSYVVPTGGVFSGTGVSGTNFNPTVAGVGTHTITYTVTNGFGCTATATSSITVLPAPVLTWTPNPIPAVCIDDAPVALTGATPTNGIFSGPGVINGIFYPAVAGAGTFTLTYTYTNTNGCSNSINNTITVNPLPIVSWTTALAPQCINAPLYNLATTGATPAGGVFAGAGVVGNNFNPALAGAGTHVLTYTYTNANGCVESASNVIVVNPLPQVSFSGVLGPLCVNSTTFALNTGVPAGGTYSGGAAVVGNNFNASVAGVGTHIITYTYTNANGCTASATNSITVNPLPVVTWTTTLPTQCVNTTSFALTGALPAGGTYSGPGVVGSFFNPSMAGVGTHTLTYTYTNVNGCTNSATNTITVSAMPTVTLGPDQSICYGDSVELIPVTVPTSSLTYAWSTGETTATIWVTAVDTATYCVTVTNSFGCASFDCISIFPKPLPIANAGPNQTICFGEFATFTATGGEGPNAYLWSTGSTSQVITVTAPDTTVYSVTVTNLQGCTDVDYVTLNVNPLPTVTLGPDQSICENMSVTLIPTGGPLQPFSNYLWSTGLENQPLVADSTGYGLNNPTTFVVTVTLNGCANKDEVVITWVPCPGIDEISKEEIITVYPNPTDGQFTVTIENVDNALTLDIYNNIGQLLVSQKLQNNGAAKFTRTFDLSSYPTGIYYLRFADGDKVRSKKLIVK